MVPISSISNMFDIIRNEDAVSCYSTELLREILYCLQYDDLTRLYGDDGHHLLRYFAGVIKPVVNSEDMDKIIKLEDTLIEELRGRGEVTLTKKFS